MKFLAALAAVGSISLLHVPSQPLNEHRPSDTQALGPRTLVTRFAASTVGWKEKTGNNDGPDVDRILDSVGLKGTRNPYCAAFIYFVGREALGDRNPYPRSAWSPDMVKGAQWVRGKGPAPQPGDVGGIYFPSKGRVAHALLIEKVQGSVSCSIEANTSPDAVPGSAQDRDGGGVYRKRRLLRQIYAIRNWIKD